MLYATTRSKIQIDTPIHSLCRVSAPDGGMYVPYRLPILAQNGLDGLKKLDFSDSMALVLNQLFGTSLTGWDLEFAVGRNPVRLHTQNYKVVVAETWHNLSWDFDGMVESLSALLQGCAKEQVLVTDWAQIAVRIAVLFGLFGELARQKLLGKNQTIDVAVTTGDFSGPIAVWYAKQMGLPVGSIICGCNENSGLWDLVHQGELNTGVPVISTITPEGDFSVPPNLERLIYETLGREESVRFAQITARKGVYHLPETLLERVNTGFYPAVVSQKRMANVVRSTFATHHYLLDPYTALAYGALQDYRVGTGELGTALILSEKSPEHFKHIISKALGVPASE